MAAVEQNPSQQRIPRSHSARLADQAATAALYVTHPERSVSLRQSTAEPDPATSKASGSRHGLSNASAAAALIAHARKQEQRARHAASVSHTADHQRTASSTHDGYSHQAAIYAIKEQKAPAAYGNRKRAEAAPSEAVRAGAGAGTSAMAEGAADPFDDLDKYMNASRIQHAHLNPKLFTATPPVAPELEELKKKSILEAASMSMAKDMYGTMGAKDGGTSSAQGLPTGARTRRSVSASKPEASTLQQASSNVLCQALSLHDVAQKRAAERLAGLEDETTAYRDYYGIEPQVARSSLTLRRRRGSDETEQFDMERSREIRTQMSALRSKLNAVDEKREKDRATLLELARKNVDAAIQDMDKQLYTEPGQSIALQKYLEERAAERAQKDSKDVDAQYLQANKVNIGGRKYVEMADMEDLARSRLQPTFDEIDDLAQTQRARDLEARLDEEQEQRLAELEREREADIRAEEERHQELLEQQQDLKSKEKAWPWKRKSRQLYRAEPETENTTTGRPAEYEASGAAAVPSEAAQPQAQLQTEEEASQTDSVLRRESKFKNWFKDKLGRRSSAPPKEANGTHGKQAANEPPVQAASDVTGAGGTQHTGDFEETDTGRAEAAGEETRQTNESGSEHEPTTKSGARVASQDNSRAAPLRSNPVTAVDQNRPAEIGLSGEDARRLDGMTPSEYFTTERNSKEVVEQSEITKQQLESESPIHELPTPSNERGAARESAAEHSLPAPPSLGDVVGKRRPSNGTARESRFSEDL
ncbi:hypothetical protein BDW62DRAFT_150006 [Aspergillus aurantiobrunneus]